RRDDVSCDNKCEFPAGGKDKNALEPILLTIFTKEARWKRFLILVDHFCGSAPPHSLRSRLRGPSAPMKRRRAKVRMRGCPWAARAIHFAIGASTKCSKRSQRTSI